MTAIITQQITKGWGTLQAFIPFSLISTEHQYDQVVEKLNVLLDVAGENEAHHL